MADCAVKIIPQSDTRAQRVCFELPWQVGAFLQNSTHRKHSLLKLTAKCWVLRVKRYTCADAFVLTFLPDGNGIFEVIDPCDDTCQTSYYLDASVMSAVAHSFDPLHAQSLVKSLSRAQFQNMTRIVGNLVYGKFDCKH